VEGTDGLFCGFAPATWRDKEGAELRQPFSTDAYPTFSLQPPLLHLERLHRTPLSSRLFFMTRTGPWQCACRRITYLLYAGRARVLYLPLQDVVFILLAVSWKSEYAGVLWPLRDLLYLPIYTTAFGRYVAPHTILPTLFGSLPWERRAAAWIYARCLRVMPLDLRAAFLHFLGVRVCIAFVGPFFRRKRRRTLPGSSAVLGEEAYAVSHLYSAVSPHAALAFCLYVCYQPGDGVERQG